MPRQKKTEIIIPFTVAVSSAEQYPYTFTDIIGDSDERYLPLVINIDRKYLKTGDYSIVGMESEIVVERKSKADLFATLSTDRDRFEEEHARMEDMKYAAVVVESEMSEIIEQPPPNSRLLPKSVLRTAMSWSMRYGVHWFFLPGRRVAELWTFQTLRKYWERE